MSMSTATSKVYFDDKISKVEWKELGDATMLFSPTGEKRAPKKGEWFLDCLGLSQATYDWRDSDVALIFEMVIV